MADIRIITPENHPQFIAVVGPTDDMEAAAREARRLIQLRRHHAVVVVRKTKHLTESFEKASGMLPSHEWKSWRITAPDRLCDARGSSAQFNSMASDYGQDFGAHFDFIRHLGPAKVEIRRADDINKKAHIDGTGAITDMPQADKDSPDLLPFGTTTTMIVRGGGTQIVKPLKGELLYNSDTKQWERQSVPDKSEREIWQAAEGDLVLMRSCNSGPGHLPCLHRADKSVFRENGKDKQRLSSVGFIYGASLEGVT
jgi:hypothetical protein